MEQKIKAKILEDLKSYEEKKQKETFNLEQKELCQYIISTFLNSSSTELSDGLKYNIFRYNTLQSYNYLMYQTNSTYHLICGDKKTSKSDCRKVLGDMLKECIPSTCSCVLIIIVKDNGVNIYVTVKKI